MSSEDPSLLQAIRAKQDGVVRRDITGMVRRAKDHETGTTRGGGLEGGGCAECPVKIEGLSPDYVVIEDGVSPSWLHGLLSFAIAVIALGATVKVVRS
jgi:hypothetical protein